MAAPRILVVEDESGIAETITYALETEGMEHCWVTTGEEAVMTQREKPFDLVLLDIGIPDMSGFDVCRELRRRDVDTLILMLTARDQLIDKLLGLKLGADDYLTKPFEPEELVARCEALFLHP